MELRHGVIQRQGFNIPGELGRMLLGSWTTCIFSTMAMAAYLGLERSWARQVS